NLVVREWVAVVLKVVLGDAARSVVARVGGRGRRVVDRQRLAGLVDQVGEIAQALLRGRQRAQVGAAAAFAGAFVGKREEGRAAAVVELRKHDRAADAEAELVAAQQ